MNFPFSIHSMPVVPLVDWGCACDTWIEWKRIWIVCVLCWDVLFSLVCLVAVSPMLSDSNYTPQYSACTPRSSISKNQMQCEMVDVSCYLSPHPTHSFNGFLHLPKIAWIPFKRRFRPEGIPQIWSLPHPSMTFVQKSLRLISDLGGCHRSSSSSSA